MSVKMLNIKMPFQQIEFLDLKESMIVYYTLYKNNDDAIGPFTVTKIKNILNLRNSQNVELPLVHFKKCVFYALMVV